MPFFSYVPAFHRFHYFSGICTHCHIWGTAIVSKQGEGLWNFYHRCNNWLRGYTVFTLLPKKKKGREQVSLLQKKISTVFQPDSLKLSRQALQISRLCGITVSKYTAVSTCTGLKQLFVQGHICMGWYLGKPRLCWCCLLLNTWKDCSCTLLKSTQQQRIAEKRRWRSSRHWDSQNVFQAFGERRFSSF